MVGSRNVGLLTHLSRSRAKTGVLEESSGFPLYLLILYIWSLEAGSRLDLGLVVAELATCQLSHTYHTYATRSPTLPRQEVRLSLLSVAAGKWLPCLTQSGPALPLSHPQGQLLHTAQARGRASSLILMPTGPVNLHPCHQG